MISFVLQWEPRRRGASSSGPNRKCHTCRLQILSDGVELVHGKKRRQSVFLQQSSAGALIAQFQQGSRTLFGVTAVVCQCAPLGADAAQLAFAETPSAARRGRAGQSRSARPGGAAPRAVSGGPALGVRTHHLPLLHASATRLGAGTPLPEGPLGSTHLPDGVDGVPAASVAVGDGGSVVGSWCKVAVFDPGSGGLPDRQHLDGEGLWERGEAPEALQGGGRAAVAQQRPLQGDVRLHGHQLVVSIQQVGAVLPAHRQVAVVVTTVAGGTLLHVQVSGAGRNGDNILVPRPETESGRGQTEAQQIDTFVREIYLPGTLQRAGHFLAGRSVSSTHSTLIEAPVGADDTITPGLHTLALDTHRGGVWAAGGPVSVLQERYWILFPSQYLPPFLGKGLSQERKEYCTPPPQVREQSPHGPHSPHPPLTGV
ncbi:hypothetical protein F7725_009101 [Dissostichus mawsoni]|uniref:Uncharacterized protein n=1 Tax=Dissostichus mawsoni TaxID=36200 RepID=A0A7J5Z605_DISMA|nr:hypothetical protein F7725_009101 [Dissostichus mawsoni]